MTKNNSLYATSKILLLISIITIIGFINTQSAEALSILKIEQIETENESKLKTIMIESETELMIGFCQIIKTSEHVVDAEPIPEPTIGFWEILILGIVITTILLIVQYLRKQFPFRRFIRRKRSTSLHSFCL